MTDVVMPQLGESVTEGTITKWFKNVGDHVAEDETLFEVSTDKVDSEVPSPAAGYVVEIKVPEGETVDVGTLLVVLADAPGAPAAAADAPGSVTPPPMPDGPPQPPPTVPAAPPPSPPPAPTAPAAAERGGGSHGSSAGRRWGLLSPLVRRLVEEHGIDPSTVAGTGVGGRITRDDVLAVVDAHAGDGAPAAPGPNPPPHRDPHPNRLPVAAPVAPVPSLVPRPGDTVVPFTNIRRRTGEHMVMSKATSPHAITAVEVDYEAVERARRGAHEQFKADEGFSLTYLPFISRAVVDTLADFPHMNATVSDGSLLVHAEVNLSIAVDLDFDGLLAPVVKQADSLRLGPSLVTSTTSPTVLVASGSLPTTWPAARSPCRIRAATARCSWCRSSTSPRWRSFRPMGSVVGRSWWSCPTGPSPSPSTRSDCSR